MLKDIDWLFNGRHFDREVTVLSVRWYLRYKLSLRHLFEIMTELGLSLTPTIFAKALSKNANTGLAAVAPAECYRSSGRGRSRAIAT
jgi:transposase-like protein